MNRRLHSGGFTLLEMALGLSLMVMLTGLVVFGFSGWQRAAALNEGVGRFETLLRAARVEAASSGRRFRLEFEPADDASDGASFSVMWEPAGLESPNEFVPYGGVFARSQAVDNLVRVRRCRLTGPSAYELTSPLADADDDDVQAITFYPDGSCDTAQIVLISANPKDTRGAVIELNGLTGTVTAEVMDAQTLETWLDENE